MPNTVKLEGTFWGPNSRYRAVIDGNGGSNTFFNSGPDAVTHSATADMGTPTTVAAGAASGAISTRRYLSAAGLTGTAYIQCGVPIIMDVMA